MTLLDLVSSKVQHILSPQHLPRRGLPSYPTRECRITVGVVFACVWLVSLRFVTNSLVLTVREPNETQSSFPLESSKK